MTKERQSTSKTKVELIHADTVSGVEVNNYCKMGGSESKTERPPILNVFTQEELQNIHSGYSSIVGNQKTLTEPFLTVGISFFNNDN